MSDHYCGFPPKKTSETCAPSLFAVLSRLLLAFKNTAAEEELPVLSVPVCVSVNERTGMRQNLVSI